MFDSCTERTKELPTRCLAPLLRAARVKPFLNPLTSAYLVDKCLDLLEVWEKEGSFDYDFFKAIVLHYTIPAELNMSEACLKGIDVESVMEMMGLPLSTKERREARYNSHITKTALSLSEAFNVYEFVRAQRLSTMLLKSKSQLRTLATQNIRQLLQDYKDNKDLTTFFRTRIKDNIVNACHGWLAIAGLDPITFRPRIPKASNS